jgi:3-oxoacyl-[acyl-carrier protein] reductase
MEKNMEMKKVLITGVSRGLGREMCLILANLGYQVHGISRTDQTLLDKELTNALHTYHQTDLAKRDEVDRFIEKTPTDYDLLILNAAGRTFKFFTEFSDDEITSFINGSFTHQLLILKHVLKDMAARKKGHIIIISSKSGIKGYSSGSIYCAVKGAWITVHESISRELRGTGINVLTIIPDSFADQQGNRLPYYSKNIEKIKHILCHLEKFGKSKLIYSLTFKTRLAICFSYCKKALFP